MKHGNYRSYTNSGLTLFELVLTICISSIVFTIIAIFITSAIKLLLKSTTITYPYPDLTTIPINLLTTDFMQNQGNIVVDDRKISEQKLTLTFNIFDPNNINTLIPIIYTCNLQLKTFTREFAGNYQTLLNQINNCDFNTKISVNRTNINLTIAIALQGETYDHNNINIYEVINAPYLP